MKKLFSISILCAAILAPTMCNATTSRPDGDVPGNVYPGCTGASCAEKGTAKTESKSKNHTGEIVAISVATGVVFVGAMYYFFKKKPSENNPGQVKLAEF